MITDTSEAALERLICRVLTGTDCDPSAAGGGFTAADPEYSYVAS